MKKIYRAVMLAPVALASACASIPPVTVRDRLPPGADVAVVMFRDCTIAGQEDCDGSGMSAGGAFLRGLTYKSRLKAAPLSRPVGPKEALIDDRAVAYAKAKGFAYVVNGDVTEYYRVAPFTFRTERAGISVRVLRTSDGAVISFFDDRTNSSSNLTTPDAMIEKMAKHVAESI
jgi:hypothetical protein